jgi:hypothetical protein
MSEQDKVEVVETVKVEPVVVEAAKVEPVVPAVEPAKTEPAKTEPVKAEPVKVEEKKTILGEEPKTPEPVIEAITLDAIVYPESANVDKEEAGAFIALANTLGMKKEQVQAIVDYQISVIDKKSKEYTEQSNKAFEEQATAWQNESKAKFGNEFENNLRLAKTAYDKYATPEFKELMEKTKLGNHPAIIETFKNAGFAIGNDVLVTPSINPTAPKEEKKLEDHYKK